MLQTQGTLTVGVPWGEVEETLPFRSTLPAHTWWQVTEVALGGTERAMEDSLCSRSLGLGPLQGMYIGRQMVVLSSVSRK